jgi:hypothetical protein
MVRSSSCFVDGRLLLRQEKRHGGFRTTRRFSRRSGIGCVFLFPVFTTRSAPLAWESPAAHRHELDRPQLPNALASFFTLVVFVDFIVLLMYEVALGI